MTPARVPPFIRQADATSAEVEDALYAVRLRQAADIRKSARKALRSANERRAIYERIVGRHQAAAAAIDDRLRQMGGVVARQRFMELDRQAGGLDVRWSEKRFQDVWALIHPENEPALAGVFTDKMTSQALRGLRGALVETFRQQAVEGLSARETNKAIQQRWGDLAGDLEDHRFTDVSGRSWENARYVQMLTRTTAQRVARETEVASLVDGGYTLGRISDDDAENCPICEAWEGTVIRLTDSAEGDFPTYQDALDGGVFHPNCVHRVDFIDETDAEIERQSGKPIEDPEDLAAVQERKTKLDLARLREDGASAEEARVALVRERLDRRARAGLLVEGTDGAFDDIPDADLAELDPDRLPRFRRTVKGEDTGSRRSERGGVVAVDPEADPAELRAALLAHLEKQAAG